MCAAVNPIGSNRKFFDGTHHVKLQRRFRHRRDAVLETGALDHDSIDRMVDFYAEKGADGLTILGMMGEAPKLTQAESIEVTRRTLARAGEKPVVWVCPPPVSPPLAN